jgi:uncharacterized protein (UPF0332 family)
MLFAEQLLEQARHLANRERRRPRQASLRRAVSTAYYALFHHLIYHATQNWRTVDQRNSLARLFEHGKMLNACEKQKAECSRRMNMQPPPEPAEFRSLQHLSNVAAAFSKCQDFRHSADYDNSRQWTRTDVLAVIKVVEEAFQSWRAIRAEPMAQAFLISLLGRPKGG